MSRELRSERSSQLTNNNFCGAQKLCEGHSIDVCRPQKRGREDYGPSRGSAPYPGTSRCAATGSSMGQEGCYGLQPGTKWSSSRDSRASGHDHAAQVLMPGLSPAMAAQAGPQSAAACMLSACGRDCAHCGAEWPARPGQTGAPLNICRVEACSVRGLTVRCMS